MSATWLAYVHFYRLEMHLPILGKGLEKMVRAYEIPMIKIVGSCTCTV